MGGGDLNLKKSWHPSTMRNMEKVWQAEQRHDQEKRRIAELQREIREEKAREDIQKFAQNTGVIEKKDEVKLDWMYKGPSGMIDREEYLLGRSIDKSFEVLQQTEKASGSASTRNPQPQVLNDVDLERKMKEDPLYAIKKIQMESRTQMLKNPVKLKHLREQLKIQIDNTKTKHKKHKNGKKEKKKRKKHRESSSSQDESLNDRLVAKYSKLKKLHGMDLTKLNVNLEQQDDSQDDHSPKIKKYGLSVPESKQHQQASKGPRSRSRSPQTKPPSPPKAKWAKPSRTKMSEEELERKRREMMDNAKWRDSERRGNIERYKAQDNKDSKHSKPYTEDFLRKQLSYAASQGTVADRIKANANNIQRTRVAMDKNFARR